MFKINEIFESFQGEGPNAGTPSVFVRLMGCDLECAWCDTKHTWHPEHLVKPIKMSEEDLVMELSQYKTNHIIFTGGEPLLQDKAIGSFISSFNRIFTFELETNGRHIPSAAKLYDYINVSPKLSNSKNINPIITSRLKQLKNLDNVYFKFVITTYRDVDEVETILKQCNIPRDKVYLMPEGTNQINQLIHMSDLSEICIEQGFKLSPRLQILMQSK